MAHVLIGFGEALPVAEVFFSLRRAGHEVSVLARGESHPARGLPVRAWRRVTAPEADAEASLRSIRDAASELAPDVILPLDDAGLWAFDAAFAPDRRLAGASGGLAAFALDKSRQTASARRAGLAVPETQGLLDAGMGWTTFPAIAKPSAALRPVANRLVKDPVAYMATAEDLRRLVDRLGEGAGSFVVQPLVRGVGEGLFGFAHDGGIAAWSAHRRLRMMNPHGSGSSACEAIPPDPALREAVGRLMIDAGWRGPFMVEFLRGDDGTAWFMEVNGRMWGSMALARRRGLEYPAWAVAATLDPAFVPVAPLPPQGPRIVRDLGRDLLHLAFVARGPRSAFHQAGWPRLWTSLRAVLRPSAATSFYNYDPDHPTYFLREAAQTVRRGLTR